VSQYDEPLCVDGYLDVPLPGGASYRVLIERVHLEEDTGKTLHVGGATGRIHGATHSLVDYNRAGIPLVEIVTKPLTGTGKEAANIARAYVTELRDLLRGLGVSDVRMEQGSLRCDVNTSLMLKGSETFGTRTETKNVNSVRFVMAVIEHEAKRQVELIEEGGEVAQETRLYDPDKNVTRSLRSKEDAHDYRYFPDPDLLPLELDEAFLEECRSSLPELPDAKRKRYEGLGITPYNAGVLTAEVETARWFDALLDAGAEPRQGANWVVAELFGALNRRNETLATTGISPVEAAELLKLVADGTISGTLAKQVFEIMLETGDAPSRIVEERGLKQTSDTGAIDAEIDKILAANADKVAEYKGGKPQLFGFFVGQTMKAMQGKANPQVVNERLRAKLD